MTKFISGIHETVNGVPRVLGPKMTTAELLKYKAILMIEGIDVVATGLNKCALLEQLGDFDETSHANHVWHGRATRAVGALRALERPFHGR